MLQDIVTEFRRHKKLSEAGLSQLDDREFFAQPSSQVNSAALIVKHVGGNLCSRWTDFLTTDGEKSTRNRDGEFEIVAGDTRDSLMTGWSTGWDAALNSLGSLSPADLERTVQIRGEPHTVLQAALRSLTHTAYHVGQILYVVRLLKPDSKWLTIAPGQSQMHHGGYFSAGQTHSADENN